MKPTKLTKDQIQNTLTTAVREAVAFIESEVAPDRIKAQRYFEGKCDLGYEEGRSKVVATKCRDTVRAIKPALMRVFLQSDKPVEFIPSRPDVVQAAEQATSFAGYVFDRNDGFSVLSDVFHDALVKKVGIAKVYYDETEEVEFDEYSGLSQEQVAFILQDPEVEVVEEEQEIQTGPDGLPFTIYTELKIARTRTHGRIRIDAVAPEDFFVDRGATSINDCYVCGHSSEARVGDLVAMGFDFETVFDLGGIPESGTEDEEEFERNGFDDADGDDNPNDPSMRKVLLTEAYMKMDIEGTGVPRLYKFICASDKYEILDYEECDLNPFAVFEVDPEPHTFFGRSLVDIILDDQDAATSLLRGLLDSISMANNPRVIADEAKVNIDDLLNNEIGAIIRAKDITAVREFAIGNGASNALPAMQFFDEAVRAKTGVSGAAMGLDADALQSQTAAGVNAAVQAATAVSELIARTLAEGGMKQLFRAIATLARQHPDQEAMMRIDGKFVPVDPRSWTANMDMACNVGLGTGKHEERLMALQGTLQAQQMIYQAGGPMNGLVTLTNIRNTLVDINRLGGIYNSDRYYMPMDPQREMQILQQNMQGQQGSDPNQAFLQAEQMKAQTKAQTDMMNAQLNAKKAQMEDDRKRDEMAQNLFVEVGKIAADTGVKLDTARLKAEQAAPRQF